MMLKETDTQMVSLTTSATDAIRNILAERNLEGYALRVYVSGGGCCGAQFNMALDNNIRENDFTYENNGIKVVVDDASVDYLRGAKIDFVNDPVRGAGFLVDSPNSKSGEGSCGCGSQGHGHEHAEAGESSCACGGSCSCSN
ncbi:MAG: iron-sulfur cluster assembly accessory protein [Chloroflexi bacterium HGW-Chloroflexi-6]|nr:MAG: iron-sulfur cluster assembly accessory protein [Chloroflexi bacterium HGW-Chloroflexi-6]